MSDTSTASELLITIKTLLDSKGLDAAKKELDKIISAGKKAGETNKDQAKEAKLLQEILGQLGRRQSEVRDVAEGMANATKGGTAGFFGMAKAAHNLWQIIQNSNPWIRLASVILAAGAAAVAVAEKMKGAGADIKTSNEAAQAALDAWRESVDKLNAKRLDALQKELADVTKGYTDAGTAAERLFRIQAMLSKSKEEKGLADLELEALNTNMPEHQKAMRALEITRAYEEQRFSSEDAALKDRENREMNTVISKNRTLDRLGGAADKATGEYESTLKEVQSNPFSGKYLTGMRVKNRQFVDKEQGEALKEQRSGLEKELSLATIKFNMPEYRTLVGPKGVESLFNKIQELSGNLASLNKLESGMLHLQGASDRDRAASAEFDKTAPQLKAEVEAGRGNLQDISAQREDLGLRRQTAAARYKARYESVAYVNDNPGQQPEDRDVNGLQTLNRFEWERMTGAVLPQSRDTDGTRVGGSRGAATRRTALDLQRSAVAAITAKSGDKEADEKIIEDLVKALQEQGTVMSMGYDQLRISLQNLEKNTAEMRRRLGSSESREKAASGLN